jgi:hypothetical protein
VYGEPFEIPQNENTTPLNSRLPYAIVKNAGEAWLKAYEKELLQTWEEMPPYFVTSALTGNGRDEVLAYIEEINKTVDYSNPTL